MKLGIMQPYFFPYLGYFDLINYTDRWIVFDTVQYIRHGWVNRNRILHPQQGWQYILVPLKKHSREAEIRDVEIAHLQKWKQRILGQLQHYKRNAPNFDETMGLVRDCLGVESDSISRLNALILDRVCAYLGIRFDWAFLSEMDLELSPVEGPGEWALRISEAVGASEYANPPGGVELFEEERFLASGIQLTIRDLPPLEYSCRGHAFIPNLSIIDVLMWNDPQGVKQYLDSNL